MFRQLSDQQPQSQFEQYNDMLTNVMPSRCAEIEFGQDEYNLLQMMVEEVACFAVVAHQQLASHHTTCRDTRIVFSLS